jgi:hypothetical protein
MQYGHTCVVYIFTADMVQCSKELT